GGEFSSHLLRDFSRGEGILQSFTLLASPQQNGVAERRIGLVMEVARTSMIHAVAPHFLWPFAVRYAAHQLNLLHRVSLPKTSPTLRWTEKVGDAMVFWVWGSRAFFCDTSAEKLSSRAIPYVFLGFPLDAPGWRFYHLTSRRVLPSQDVTFDESFPFYHLFPYRTAPLPPLLLFLAPGAARGAASGGAEPTSLEPGGAEPKGAEPGGAESEGAESRGVEPEGAEPGGTEPEGAEPGGADSGGADSGGAEPRGPADGGTGAGGARATSPGGAGVLLGPEVSKVLELLVLEVLVLKVLELPELVVLEALELETLELEALALEALELEELELETLELKALELEALDLEALELVALELETLELEVLALGVLELAVLVLEALCNSAYSPLPAPSPYAEQTDSLTKRREPESRLASPVRDVRTGRRVPCLRPPPVPGTHIMALRPSFVPLRVPLPSPPASSLPDDPHPESALARGASPTVPRLLATAVTNPSFESIAASSLVAELVDFAAASRLDYTASLVAESEFDCPPSVGGECALGTDVLEDRQEDFECLAAAVPHLVAMLFAPEGDPDAPDIPTPSSYAEAIEGPYSSQWQTAMDAEIASLKSTSTYFDAVPPYGVNIVDDMWIFPVLQCFGFRYYSLSAPASYESVEPSGPYPELVGCLMYLMTCTRPEPAYPLSILARYIALGRHRPEHWEATQRVLHYLCSTSGMGLVLGGRGPIVLTGHVDASWVDNLATQRCEAEEYTGAMAAQELRWLTYVLTDLGERPRSSPILYVDNKAMIALCQEHRREHRTKHIALRYFFARELH
ncbi:unnamed protein product, partial [Closterium sp. NIES-53]